MVSKSKLNFEEWVGHVDVLIDESFNSSLLDLEDDIDEQYLKECYQEGMTPKAFVKLEVEPLFDLDDDDS